MKNEINISKGEFAEAVETISSQEYPSGTNIEFTSPAREFYQSDTEYSELSEPVSSERQGGAVKKKKKRTKKLLNHMAYLVASAVAVVTIAGTIGSSIEQNVAAEGGNIRADVRFSIQWNDRHDNQDDLDAHCIEPDGYEIYYGNRGMLSPSGGDLDVDITDPYRNTAVENIAYSNKRNMQEGTYQFFVYNYSSRGARSGFTAQLKVGNRVYHFTYRQPLMQSEVVEVATVTYKNGVLTVEPHLSN